jgi:hypothetical protein
MADQDDIGKLLGRRMVAGQEPRTRHDGDLEKLSAEHRAALSKIIENGVATGVRILVYHDCCPVCRAYEGAYEFGNVPQLPLEGCSHPLGCRCHYAPILDKRGP